MKFIISFFLFTQFSYARTPIMIFSNSTTMEVETVKKIIMKNFNIPEDLIETRFSENPCKLAKKEELVLSVCLKNKKLLVVQKNPEAINNTYRVFRNIK